MTKYSEAGVDLSKAESIKEAITRNIRSTYTKSVLSAGGEFGGILRLDDSQKLVVASIDGVGTKLKVAVRAGIHDTIGEDLVNHCINDIAVMGAKPVMFLDYFATGELEETVVLQVVEGLARACKAQGVALIGGETAQMPDIYQPGEYDLAGAIFGVMEEEDRLPRESIGAGDILVGFQSNGLHTNGYSLARHVIFQRKSLKTESYEKELGRTWGEELLRVHRCYLPHIVAYRTQLDVKGFAHITGGGIAGNLGRVLPDGISAEIETVNIPVQPVFEIIQRYGKIEESEMYDVFNMGVGLIAVLSPEHAEKAIQMYPDEAFHLGKLVGSGKESQVRLLYPN